MYSRTGLLHPIGNILEKYLMLCIAWGGTLLAAPQQSRAGLPVDLRQGRTKGGVMWWGDP